ncbi:hypothetical protein HY501_00015 [Candidatus Woesearchaeota archaeon]|nr:hypothetical protein [Candidatus Woesearchaeota archaeon]
MDKRGQIYILVALVLALVIFGLNTVTNKASQVNLESNFRELSDNYATESVNLVNSLLSNSEDVASSFINFTLLFTSYAKTINPRFGLIYAFEYDDKVYLGNYLDDRINLLCETCLKARSIAGCYEQIPASITFEGLETDINVYNNVIGVCNLTLESADFAGGVTPAYINITIKNIPYQFLLKQGTPDLAIVSWEAAQDQRKVFLNGDFAEASGDLVTLNEVCNDMGASECDLTICRILGPSCVVECNTHIDEEGCLQDSGSCYWENEVCNNAV